MGIISKWSERRKLVDETMEKLLKQLSVSNDWRYDGGLEYKHIESEIVIKWGYEGGYDGSVSYRRIMSPIYFKIPIRFRGHVGDRLNVIKNRDRSQDDLSFFSEYMDGAYRQKLEINKKKKSEIAVWMMENKITECHIMDDVIWFKNEEDALAVKLVWV